MNTLEDAMPRFIDRSHPRFSRRAPHQKHDPLRPLLCHDINNFLREFLPPFLGVTVGLLMAYGQNGVEH